MCLNESNFPQALSLQIKLGLNPRCCQLYKVNHPKHVSLRQATLNNKEQNKGEKNVRSHSNSCHATQQRHFRKEITSNQKIQTLWDKQ
jgi:hypothetical protein